MADISSKKVLIVEDEKPLSMAFELKLGKVGVSSKIANNGIEALEILKTEKFDLIMMDLMMPQMDGFTLLTKLQEQGITTPVVVLTNLSQTEDEKKVKALGAKDFIIKSNVPIAKIVDRVSQMLAQ